MKKKILSGILAFTMCFTMMPSATWGSDIMGFSAGVETGSADEEGIFIDGSEIEDNNAVAAEESEGENSFCDGQDVYNSSLNDRATVNSRQSSQHTIVIQDVEPFQIEKEKTIVDIINNHDGTLTIGENPVIYVGENISSEYKLGYRQNDAPIRIGEWFSGKNPESESESDKVRTQVTFIPEDRKVSIKGGYLHILVCKDTELMNNVYVAAVQANIRCPVEVSYDLQSGTDGPKTDWVWDDNVWNTDHDKEPKRQGYKFDGWYTKPNGNGEKITDALRAYNIASRKITLYAKWIHEHSWQYDVSGNSIKAYCTNDDSKCEYYGTNKDDARVVVSLDLTGLDEEGCISYSGSAYTGASCTGKDVFNKATGKSVSTIKYVGRAGTSYQESETAPTLPGKYSAKVYITELNKEISADFEITKAPITLSVKLGNYTYGTQPSIQLQVIPSDSTVIYECKSQDAADSSYRPISVDDLKTLPAGEYTLRAIVNETENYDGRSSTCNFTVDKANATNSDSKVHMDGWTYGSYDVNYNAPSIDQNLNPEDQEVRYTYYIDSECTTETSTVNGTDANGGVPQNVGTYYVKAQISASDNYNEGKAVGSFEIKPCPVKLEWSDSEFTYDGKEKSVYATVENALEGDTFELVYENAKGTNAQEYVAKVTDLGNSNYSLFDKDGKPIETISHSWKITKADIKPTSVKIDNWTYGSYNGTKNKPSVDAVTNPGNGDVVYTYYTDGKCTSPTTPANSGATKNGELPKNVGTYYVKAEIPATDNYNSTTAEGSFKIEPRPAELEWSASKLTYNGEEQKVTATVKNAVSGDNFNLTYDNNIGKETGNYTTMVKGLGNSNYSLTKDGILIDTISHSWKIEPKEVTVTPNHTSKHVGKADPELTYTANGLVTNEELTGITLTRETGEGSGTYKITATEDKNANPNYKVKTETGTFTIIGHSWSEPETKIKPTTWSEGKEERTCTVKECGQKRYDTILKTGESRDEYADRIEKYVQGFDTEDKNTIREATLNNKETQLLKESNIFGAEEKEKIENQNAKAKVWIELTPVTLTKEQEDAIRKEAEKFAGTNEKLCPFDMNLFRQMDGENQVQITDPGINMNIRFRIPDDMINNQSYTIRNYKIIRMHNSTGNSVIDVLDTSFNSSTNEITFETDKFSVYALTYKDTYYSPSYPVTGIKVSPDTLTLTKKDETAQLTAEVTPSYADNKKVTWKSSDEKVATVDENGKVTAVANGTATITATSVSGNYTATVSVTVKIPVEIEKITIETEKETLTKIGESTELKVKIEPENADPQKLTWKSSDEKVAIVDENGKVTAAANGTATITVTTEDGKHTASVTITVNIPDEPVISNTTGFGRLKARSTKQTKTSVTLEWSRIDDADGYFIYGSRCNTSTKSYKYKKLATITNGNTRTWTQKGLKKATYYKYVVKAYKIVNGKKVVTDTSASVHTVTQGGKYGVAKSVSVTKIGNKKNVTKITLKKGKTAQITAKEIKKDNKIKQHRNLCYESSNTKVATVTSKGLIRAVGKGTCTIWVYAQNGVYKALTITVK